MSHETGQWDLVLDAIAHQVHAKHGQSLQFFEAIAREIFIRARSLGIPNEAIHHWATERERMLHQDDENPAAKPESHAAAQIDRGLLIAYRASEQVPEVQN